MLTVTETAEEKLKEILTKKGSDSEKTIRIIASDSEESDLDFVWDKVQKNDYVVKNHDGITVLVINLDLANSLKGMTLDFGETTQGSGSTLNKIAPVS